MYSCSYYSSLASSFLLVVLIHNSSCFTYCYLPHIRLSEAYGINRPDERTVNTTAYFYFFFFFSCHCTLTRTMLGAGSCSGLSHSRFSWVQGCGLVARWDRLKGVSLSVHPHIRTPSVHPRCICTREACIEYDHCMRGKESSVSGTHFGTD